MNVNWLFSPTYSEFFGAIHPLALRLAYYSGQLAPLARDCCLRCQPWRNPLILFCNPSILWWRLVTASFNSSSVSIKKYPSWGALPIGMPWLTIASRMRSLVGSCVWPTSISRVFSSSVACRELAFPSPGAEIRSSIVAVTGSFLQISLGSNLCPWVWELRNISATPWLEYINFMKIGQPNLSETKNQRSQKWLTDTKLL